MKLGRKRTEDDLFDGSLIDLGFHNQPDPADHQGAEDRQSRRRSRADGATAEIDTTPDLMRGNETVWGFGVGLELIVISIINLVVTHGKGAPAHHDSTWMVEVGLGLVSSVAFFPLIMTKKRTTVAFGGIVAAFFVTLPRVPDSLADYHIVALAIPAAYGIILASRRRKGEKVLVASGAGSSRTRRERSRRSTSAGRDTGSRKKSSAATPTGPRANSRYTPPKPKRKAPGRS